MIATARFSHEAGEARDGISSCRSGARALPQAALARKLYIPAWQVLSSCEDGQLYNSTESEVLPSLAYCKCQI